MKPKIEKIDAVLSDLDLISAEINTTEPLQNVFKHFEKDERISGIIVRKNGLFYRMLSRQRFYKAMSKEFMFDLFSKRTVDSFFHENKPETYLQLKEDESILVAASKALQREEFLRLDPIIVELNNGGLMLLNFYELLLAQTRVHLLTLNSLKEANDFKKEILGIAAHDLRNPLNIIIGFSEEIKELGHNNTDITYYAGHINSEAKQMNDLLIELLHTAANDAIEFELNRSDFDLAELINLVIFSFQHSLDSKKQKTKFLCNEEIIINADKKKIKEVVENLISNAIKYSHHGKHITVTLSKNESIVELKVQDEGLGMTESDLQKIFGKYQKLSAKPTNNESSTGLGLFIVKKIIDQHNGNILVDSSIGKGTTFNIILPNIKQNRITSLTDNSLFNNQLSTN
jgi:signal transduction histidine kinase